MELVHTLLPCCKADEHQAIQLLEWIAELGFNNSSFFLLCADDCQVTKMMELAQKGFQNVKWLRDAENIKSDWRDNGNHIKSAAGPNSLFRQAAWWFHVRERGPWLFLEPDAIPCRKDWLEELTKEYHLWKKPFMGFLVTRQTHPGDVGQHMSGVAVYSPDTPGLAPMAVLGTDVAFDIAGAEDIVGENAQKMHNTRLIFHRYRPPTFDSKENFDERVKSEYAIYHACKDGSIYPFLRNRLFGTPVESKPVVPKLKVEPTIPVVPGANGVSSGVTCDIFIKTREHDYDWLEWCLKSIERNCSGFRRLNIQAPIEGKDLPYVSPIETKVIWDTHDPQPGYLWQQVCKLHADQYSDADYILFTDSDTIFTRPITPSEFIKDGKPIWLYTPFGDARSDQQIWVPVMEKFLGKRPEHEFMRRHPFIVPRWAFEALRTFCLYKHGKTLEQYIMEQDQPGKMLVFSEWNCLGFFLWEYHRDKVEWVIASEAGPACTFQGHTHEGEARKQKDIEDFKRILGSTPQLDGCITKAEEGVTPPPLTIQSAIEFLASSENIQDSFYKARVLRDLKKAWKDIKPPEKAKNKAHSVQKEGILLCIHSYPGANETVERHWNNFLLSGATRIVGIGTTDGKCRFPCESVNIGENAYMKMKGKDDHLCQRLLDTIKWCLTQKEDKFIICEYDVLFLKKFPKFNYVSACLTGGKVNGSKTNQFFHPPWAFCRDTAKLLILAMETVLPECQEYPNNSPDLFFGYACERMALPIECNFKMFTRNSLNSPGDLDLAVQAAVDGAHVIHGCKLDHEYFTIMNALKEKELSLSHSV